MVMIRQLGFARRLVSVPTAEHYGAHFFRAKQSTKHGVVNASIVAFK